MQSFLRADPARERIAKAAEQHRAGSLEEAEAIYREILQHDPKHVEALRLLAQVAMQSEHYGQAEKLLKRAVEIAPDYLAAWIDLSPGPARAAGPRGGAREHRACGGDEPASAIVQLHQANVLARSGRHEEAVATYRRRGCAQSRTARRPGSGSAIR